MVAFTHTDFTIGKISEIAKWNSNVLAVFCILAAMSVLFFCYFFRGLGVSSAEVEAQPMYFVSAAHKAIPSAAHKEYAFLKLFSVKK